MFARLRTRMTFANVMSVTAVFIALGGTSVATHEAIFSDDIVDGQIQRQDLGFEAVSTGKILDGTVRTQDLQSGALTTSAIGAGAVTSPKLASNSVTGDKVVNDTLTGADVDESSLAIPGGLTGLEKVTATSTLNHPSSGKYVDMTCPAGKRVVSGGYFLQGTYPQQASVVVNGPVHEEEGWSVTIEDELGLDGSSWWIEGFALCATAAP